MSIKNLSVLVAMIAAPVTVKMLFPSLADTSKPTIWIAIVFTLIIYAVMVMGIQVLLSGIRR